VIEGVVEYLQFNTASNILIIISFNDIPTCVIMSVIALCYLIIIWLFYCTYRKYNAIDNHINKKIQESKSQN